MNTIQERTHFDPNEPVARYEVIKQGNILAFLDNLFCVAVWVYEGNDILTEGHLVRHPDDEREISDGDMGQILGKMFAHFAPHYPKEFQRTELMSLQLSLNHSTLKN